MGRMLSRQEPAALTETTETPPKLLQELPLCMGTAPVSAAEPADRPTAAQDKHDRTTKAATRALGDDAECAVTRSTPRLCCQLLKVTLLRFTNPKLPSGKGRSYITEAWKRTELIRRARNAFPRSPARFCTTLCARNFQHLPLAQ